MKVLDTSQTLILVTSQKQQKTYLLTIPMLTIVSSCNGYYRIGSLQYSTGIAALASSSQVRFHDFRYNKKLQQIQTVLNLVKIKLIKNLLFCIAEQRILIYDIATKSNLCHIPTIIGHLVTVSASYKNLKLLYPIQNNIYHQLQLWKNKTQKIQCDSIFSNIVYDCSGNILCFCQQANNVVALYDGQGMVKGCSLEGKVQWVLVSNCSRGKFYIKTIEKKTQNNNGNINPRIFHIALSLTNKQYLKLSQQTQQSQLQSQNQIYFQHNNRLMLWHKNKIYKMQVDNEPLINQISNLSTNGLLLSNPMVNNSMNQQNISKHEIKINKFELQPQKLQKQQSYIQPIQQQLQIEISSNLQANIDINIDDIKMNTGRAQKNEQGTKIEQIQQVNQINQNRIQQYKQLDL